MTTRNLLSGPVTLSHVVAKDRNMLHALQYPRLKEDFYQRIEGYRPLLAHEVACHFHIKSSDVNISPQEYWRHGSFNLCVPVMIEVDQSMAPKVPQFVMLRFPLPYRVGEATNPGNSDEKISCEAATYAWLSGNCPTVPIPRLYGFGFSTGKRFTHLEFLPWWSRWFQQARRLFLAVLGFQQPSKYVCTSNHMSLGTGYLLIETITSGSMLSETWEENRHDDKLQENLQRGLARIMLSLASIHLPRIGSFRLDDSGYLHLDNRPLSVHCTVQENEGILSEVSRDTTFSTVNDYVLHHIAAFDNQLLQQPNSVTSHDDAWYQMTSLAAAKSVFPQFFRTELCKGPFTFMLTDLHRSNIFVDEHWNITCIIDLEFAGSRPLEFLQTPYWLGGELIDEIKPTAFEAIHNKFLNYIKIEEQLRSRKSPWVLSSIIHQAWENGTFWITLAIRDSIAFTEIFYDRILPGFLSVALEDAKKVDYAFFARFWRPNIAQIIDQKMKDRDRYLENLATAFADDE